jgi:Family of unknown function (DUF6169)
MSIQEPYKFIHIIDEYSFTTNNGIEYLVLFSDGAFLFANLPAHIPVYEVTITVVSLSGNASPPHDLRAEATFVKIFQDFLTEHQNSIVYVCDTTDNKQGARHRKFNIWFHRNESVDIEKYDTQFVVGNLVIYASLMLHSLHPFKETMIDVFINQKNEYDKGNEE